MSNTQTTRPDGDALHLMEDPSQALMFFAVIVASAVVMKIVFEAMFVVYIIAFPIIYLYAVQKCPSNESFDAKKELKRVLRGYHLPDNDPNKPKGLIGETLARVQASAATEVAMAPGYEITIYVSKRWELSDNSHYVNIMVLIKLIRTHIGYNWSLQDCRLTSADDSERLLLGGSIWSVVLPHGS